MTAPVDGTASSSWLPSTPLSTRFPLYSRANADEVLPGFVSPLGVTLSWDGALLEGWREGNHDLGALSDAELADPTNTCGAFRDGFFYVNVSLVRVFGIRSGAGADAVDAAFFAGHAGIPPHEPHPEDADAGAAARASQHLAWAREVTRWPEVDELRVAAEQARASRPPLASLAASALVARARSLRPVLRETFRLHAVATTDAAVGPALLAALLPDADPALRIELVGAADDVDSEQLLHDLWAIGREVRACEPLTELFDQGPAAVAAALGRSDLVGPLADVRARLDRFLADHGSRGTDEWDLAALVWELDPTPVLAVVDQLRARPDTDDPARRCADAARRRNAADAEARRLVGRGADRIAALEQAQGMARRFFAWRERTKTAAVRLVHEQRMAMHELGRRAAAMGVAERADDVFLLVDQELDAFAAEVAGATGGSGGAGASGFGAELAVRRAGAERLALVTPPLLLHAAGASTGGVAAGGPEVPAVAESGEVLVGAPGCAGLVVGHARVVLDPADARHLGRGDVLVAPRTDPSWTPLFLLAAGVVAGAGAFASHTVIVARELGIPCVVGLPDAVGRIPDGALVEVDGSRGTVRLL